MPLVLSKSDALGELQPLYQEAEAELNPPTINTYGPEVEKWRKQLWRQMPDQLKSRPDAATLLDKALYVIEGESGGSEHAVGDSGAAYGLAQSHHIPAGSDATTQINDMWRLVSADPTTWRDWGEGATYNGKPFGALGNKSYNGGGGAIAGSVSDIIGSRPPLGSGGTGGGGIANSTSPAQSLPTIDYTDTPTSQPSSQIDTQGIPAITQPDSQVDTQGLPITQPSIPLPNTPNLTGMGIGATTGAGIAGDINPETGGTWNQNYGPYDTRQGQPYVDATTGSLRAQLEAERQGQSQYGNAALAAATALPIIGAGPIAGPLGVVGGEAGHVVDEKLDLPQVNLPVIGKVGPATVVGGAAGGLGGEGEGLADSTVRKATLVSASQRAALRAAGWSEGAINSEFAGNVKPNLRIVQPGEFPTGTRKLDPLVPGSYEPTRGTGVAGTARGPAETPPGALGIAGGTGPKKGMDPAEFVRNARAQGLSDAQIKEDFPGMLEAAGGIDTGPQVTARTDMEQAAKGAAAKRTYERIFAQHVEDLKAEGYSDAEARQIATGLASREARRAAAAAPEALPEQKPNVLATEETRSAIQEAQDRLRGSGNAIVEEGRTPVSSESPSTVGEQPSTGEGSIYTERNRAVIGKDYPETPAEISKVLADEAKNPIRTEGTPLSANEIESARLGYGARALGDPFSEIRAQLGKQGRKGLQQAVEGESDQERQSREEAIFRQASEDAIAKKASSMGVNPEDLSVRDRAAATAEVLDRLQKAKPGQSIEDILTPGASSQSAEEVQSARAARGGRYTPEEAARLRELRTNTDTAARNIQQQSLQQTLEETRGKTFTPPTDNPNAEPLSMSGQGGQLGISEGNPSTSGALGPADYNQVPRFDAESIAERARLSAEYAKTTGGPQLTEQEFRQELNAVRTARDSGRRWPENWDTDRIHRYQNLEQGLTGNTVPGAVGQDVTGGLFPGPLFEAGPTGGSLTNKELSPAELMNQKASLPLAKARETINPLPPTYIKEPAIHRAWRELISPMNAAIDLLTYGHGPMLRQGLGVTFNPFKWSNGVMPNTVRAMVALAKNPEAYDAFDRSLNSMPMMAAGIKDGVIPAAAKEGAKVYHPTILERVTNVLPGMQNNKAAARGFLNAQRKFNYEANATKLARLGITDTDSYKAMWGVASDNSGHGLRGGSFSIGGINPIFSPQAALGRIRSLMDPVVPLFSNPKAGGSILSYGARQEAVQNLLTIGVFSAAVDAGLGALGFDLNIGANTPLGRMKFGASDIDPTGGIGSVMKFGYKAVDALLSGDAKGIDDATSSFVEGQFGPVPDVALNMHRGTDWQGKDYNLVERATENPLKPGSLVRSLAMPIDAQSIADAIKAHGFATGLLIGAPSIGAMHVQTNLVQAARDKEAQSQFGKPYEDLLQSEKDKVNTAPNVQDEVGQPSELKQNTDRIKAQYDDVENRALQDFKAGKLTALSGGGPTEGVAVQNMPDAWHQIGLAKRSAMSEFEQENSDTLGKIPPGDFQRVTNPYFNTTVHVKDSQGKDTAAIDYDATAAKQQDYVNSLSDAPNGTGPSDKAIMQDAITRIEGNKSEAHQRYDKYIQERKQAGYFNIDPTDPKANEKRLELDRANPLQDALQWYWKGGTQNGTPPTLNTAKGVDIALQMAPSRPVVFGGLGRPVNQSPQTLAAWQEYGPRIDSYFNKAVPAYREDIAKQLFSGLQGFKDYASLDLKNQARVNSYILTNVKNGSPELEAVLQYFGHTKDANGNYPVSPAAVPELQKILNKYGEAPVHPQSQFGPASQFVTK